MDGGVGEIVREAIAKAGVVPMKWIPPNHIVGELTTQ